MYLVRDPQKLQELRDRFGKPKKDIRDIVGNHFDWKDWGISPLTLRNTARFLGNVLQEHPQTEDRRAVDWQ